MTIASIDLGSNSVILLIANYCSESQELINIEEYFATPRISENLLLTGLISKNSFERLDGVLENYFKMLKEKNCDVILVNATNAFRIAQNADEIKDYFENKYKIEVCVLNGIEEARLSFMGTILPYKTNKNSFLIDIGGGSTEFIYGNGINIIFRKSIQLGVVSLFEKCFKYSKNMNQSIMEAENYVLNMLHEIDFHFDEIFETYAVAGSPTTLSAIALNLKKYSSEAIDNTSLDLKQLEFLKSVLWKLSPTEMRIKYGEIVEGREELILGGCLILTLIMKHFSIGKIIVSTKGLRFGAVYDYLLNEDLFQIKN